MISYRSTYVVWFYSFYLINFWARSVLIPFNIASLQYEWQFKDVLEFSFTCWASEIHDLSQDTLRLQLRHMLRDQRLHLGTA